MEFTSRLILAATLCCMTMACAGPEAMFRYKGGSSAPALLSFENLSRNAGAYQWYIGDSLVSRDTTMHHRFLHSGRYAVGLVARQEEKSDFYSEELIIGPPEGCVVYMRTTAGEMAFRLLESTPGHRENFIAKIESGYYDGRIFHRVIEGFMIQAGGGEDTSREEIPAEIKASNVHVRGALAAARMPDHINPGKKSSAGQFYIVQGRIPDRQALLDYGSEKLLDYTEEQIEMYLDKGGTPQLDMEYTVFGYLVFGDEVIDRIAGAKTDAADKPLEDIIIEEIKLLN